MMWSASSEAVVPVIDAVTHETSGAVQDLDLRPTSRDQEWRPLTATPYLPASAGPSVISATAITAKPTPTPWMPVSFSPK